MKRSILFALLLAAPLALAQTPPHKTADTLRAEAKALIATETTLAKRDICQNPHYTQADLNECFAEEAHRIDASYIHLVRILGALLREQTVDDRSTDAPPSIAPKQFDSAESSWQSYRKSTCTAVAFQYDGGSMQPMQFSGCFAAVTVAHMKEIVPLYAEEP